MAFVAEQFLLDDDEEPKTTFSAEQFDVGEEREPFAAERFDVGFAADHGEGLAALSGFTPPAEQMADWTQADRDTINEYGPSVLAGAAGLLVPGASPLVAGLSSMALGTGARMATPLLKGEGMDAALAEADPRSHPYQLAIEGGLPFVGKAISAGLKARRMSDLPDFTKAISGNADLPRIGSVMPDVPSGAIGTPVSSGIRAPSGDLPIDSLTIQDIGVGTRRVPGLAPDVTGVNGLPTAGIKLRSDLVSRDALALTPREHARATITGAARRLMKGETEAEQLAGTTLKGWGAFQRQVRNQAHGVIEDAFKGLSRADAEAAGAVMRRELSVANVSPRVAQAVERSKVLLDEMGDRALGIPGMMTRAKDTGELQPFAKIGDDYFPWVARKPSPTVKVANLGRSGRVDPAQAQRTGKFDPERYVTNAKEALLSYVDDFSRDMAASHYFGPRAGGVRWGEKADALWDRMLADNKPMSASLFASRMNKIMNPPTLSSTDRTANAIAAKTAQVALGQSAMTSWPQVGTNMMRSGIGNTIEGTSRWLTDPSMKQMFKASGAMDPGVTNMALEAGVGQKSLPARWMQWTEGKLRGALNAGTVPYIEKLIARVQAGDRSAATLRQLSELGIDMGEAQGGVTADLMRRGIQASSDANQLQAHAVENAGEIFDSPLGRTVGQFMQYPTEAARLAQDSVLAPIGSGVRNMAPSDVQLGLGRAARWIPATLAAAGAKNLIKSRITGRDFDPMESVYDTAETIGGLPASMATTVARGFNPADSFGKAPAIGLLAQSGQSAKRVFSEDEQMRGLAELIADAVAAYDKTGTGALLRPTVRGLLRGNDQ